jgi:cyclophilin family peptidyl-prolyl cis-trans isomerase
MKRLLITLPLTCVLAGATLAAGYRVVNPVQPGMPDNMARALQHVKVSPPSTASKVPAKAQVRLETSKGNVLLELNGAAAPLHVRSFLHLSRMGFYDKTVFHRFAALMGGNQGRIIQGGDPFTKVPTTRQYAGQGGPGYQVPREPNSLKHDAMVIAAARTNDPNSAGSQFYITLDPTYFLDTTGGGYTVFGKVVSGKNVVLKLRQGDTIKKVVILGAPAKNKKR